MAEISATHIRHDWTREEALALFELPFNDLMFRAQTVHRHHFDANRVQISTLLSIKTGGCPEDCAYCPQSAHFETEVDRQGLLDVAAVIDAASKARDAGASRFCMGAAWRGPGDRALDQVIEMIQGVGALGLETCATLGMLNDEQAARLKGAGLDYYNHNIDTSEEFYGEIITTRGFGDRLETLARVRDAGIKLCCGGIIGMGESRADRGAMLTTLATLPRHPESVPINMLVRVAGTPLGEIGEAGAGLENLDEIEFVRTLAVARIMMPLSMVRLSAGRDEMSETMQALCFLAGANSIFRGDQLLTTDNAAPEADRQMFARLGLQPMERESGEREQSAERGD